MSVGIQAPLTLFQSQTNDGFDRQKEMPVSVAAAHTVRQSQRMILADATTAPFAVTLFPVANNASLRVTVVKVDASANAVTVDGNAAETISGALTHALTAQWSVGVYYCDGSQWINLTRNSLL